MIEQKQALKQKENNARPNIKFMMKQASDAPSLKADKIKLRHDIRTDYPAPKMSEKGPKNTSDFIQKFEKKIQPFKPSLPSQQKSFSSDKNAENKDTSAYISARTPAVHKRTKTLGDKNEFIVSRSKPAAEMQGSALMQKLSEKLHIDIGKLVKNNGIKGVDIMVKKGNEKDGREIHANKNGPSFEVSSLAKKIAEIKASKPLTERSNLNHIRKSQTFETTKSSGMTGLIKHNHFVINDRIKKGARTDSISSPDVNNKMIMMKQNDRSKREQPSLVRSFLKSPILSKQEPKSSRTEIASSKEHEHPKIPIQSFPSNERKPNTGSMLLSERKAVSGHKPSKSSIPFQSQPQNPIKFSKFELSNPDKIFLPSFDKTKTIIRPLGPIACFCVNTNKGNTRNYNEDRVSVLLNAQQK